MLETVQYDAKPLFQLPPIGLLYSTYRYSTGAGTVPEKKKQEGRIEPGTPGCAANQQNHSPSTAAHSFGCRGRSFLF